MEAGRYARRALFSLWLAFAAFPSGARANCGPALRQLLASAPSSTQIYRRLADIKTLEFGSFNVEKLYVEGSYEHLPRSAHVPLPPPKPVAKLEALGRVLRDADLDVVALQEVGGYDSLETFQRQYLRDHYRVLMVQRSDKVGDETAFLVKRDLPFEIELRHHGMEKWTDPVDPKRPSKLFTRDPPTMIVRERGKPEGKPLFVYMGVHLKSKVTSPGYRSADVHSEWLREAQANRVAEIAARYMQEFGKEIPVLVGGDFNGDLIRESTFRGLWSRFTDALSLGDRPLADRVTATHHPESGPAVAEAVDSILITSGHRGLVADSEVYRYRDELGRPLPIPTSLELRRRNPSDHFLVRLRLRFAPLVRPAPP